MNNDAKINEAVTKLGIILLNNGFQFTRDGFKAVKYPLTKEALKIIITEKTGLSPDNMSLYDAKYYVTDWETWKYVIDKVMIDAMVYQIDFSDCDNFAFLFTAISSMIFGLSSAPVVTGQIYNATTNEPITRHAFNFIVAKDGNNFNVYCYEPQSDRETIIRKGLPTIIRNWKYTFDWLTLF